MASVSPGTTNDSGERTAGETSANYTPPSAANVKNRQILYLIEDAETKVVEAGEWGRWEKKRICCILCGTLLSMIGTLLILYGLSLTVLFQGFEENRIAALCGMIVLVPSALSCLYICCPWKNERIRRRRIKAGEEERRNVPKLIEQLKAKAEERARPPPILLRVVAVVRQARSLPLIEIAMIVSYLEEVCLEVEKQCGLRVEQQMVQIDGKEIHERKVHLVTDLNLKKNKEIWFYNRGKYVSDLLQLEKKAYKTKHIVTPKPVEDLERAKVKTLTNFNIRRTSIGSERGSNGNGSRRPSMRSGLGDDEKKTGEEIVATGGSRRPSRSNNNNNENSFHGDSITLASQTKLSISDGQSTGALTGVATKGGSSKAAWAEENV